VQLRAASRCENRRVGNATTELRTQRLIIRRLRDDDAPFMRELMNEPGWLSHIGDRGVRTDDDARAYIRRAAVEPHERLGFSLGCVELRESGERLGICGLVQRDALPAPDLGFAFLARHEGRGFAREAAAACLDQAHAELGLERVVAITSASNDRALRLLRALGFTDEGTVALGTGRAELLLLVHGSADRP
jgi:ribosomal-protein-alanine N-acetyltransferase